MVESKREREESTSSSLSLSDRRERRKRKREVGEDVEESTVATAGATGKKETATRTREEAELARMKAAQGRGENLPVLGGLVTYFRGVVSEVQKVTWPTREEARRLTTIVLSVTIVAAIVLGAIDFFYGWWFQQGLEDARVYLVIAALVFGIGGALSWRFILREQS